jgi:hypothetical protein
LAETTSTTVQCKFTDRDGKELPARNIDGRLWSIGDNLKATEDLAKKELHQPVAPNQRDKAVVLAERWPFPKTQRSPTS